MLNLNPKDYKPYAELICDWSDKLEFLVKYMEIGFLVRHEMITEKAE